MTVVNTTPCKVRLASAAQSLIVTTALRIHYRLSRSHG